jgi:coproporphyrinogen III oxidase-like Fe-S oxidoreductase
MTKQQVLSSFAKAGWCEAQENLSGFMRRTNTANIQDYLQGNRIDEKEIEILNESDLLIEEFFLRLRTKEGIADL